MLEEFCLVTGLKFGVEYSDEYEDKDKPIPFRRRVFPSRLDGKHITEKDVEELIKSKLFKKLDDDDAVSLCCIGILQLVLLDIPETPLYNSKPMVSKHYKKKTDVKVGKNFDIKEALDLAIRLKAFEEGYQFLKQRSAPESNPENVRSNVLMKLHEALDEEAILEEQILFLMHRFVDRFTDRRVEINNLMVLHDHSLIDYGKYAFGCMTGTDMKKCVYLKSVRDELLRSMKEKRQLITNYIHM
uniref:Uncharacterized protein n=1 Tax=Tanacetum cinerariifolium TaxID=118510 RepID=A0A699HLT4_TANCI|nr:hypothetical protein [Tanacetum cinerariifolium]